MGNSDQDLRTKKVKRSLEGWREILLNAHSILLWEKQWHPGAVFGALSAVFLLLWAFDPSILTTLATIGLLVTVGDYLVPTIAASIFRQDNWTGAKEKKFDEICRNIVFYYTQISTLCASYYLMRSVRPKIYYSTAIGTLLILAWLGSSVNNLFLTYLLILMMLMSPGLEQHGLISKYGCCISNRIKNMTKTVKVDNKTE